ncbi:MAG: hypothetical protein K8M05_07590 [Deltaproteobacteria bacterium]|nr:hypothetical protein [Kofleriaceae bacterium]
MIKHLGLAAVFALTIAGCAEDAAPPDPSAPALELDADDTLITGSFVHAGSVIGFRSELTAPARAVLQLDVNGAVLDVTLDLGAQTYSDDGHLNALDLDELAALVALRDAVAEARPELLDTLHGKLLVRHADRMAEAPAGVTLRKQFIDIAAAQASRFENRADADGCGGDGATCLWGTNGWDYAVYDPGSDGTCVWKWAQYGENEPNCSGRCGSGCNHWFDDDYTWDCFDHDRCVTHFGGSVMSDNGNCGDEFWDASDDYVLTYGPWC